MKRFLFFLIILTLYAAPAFSQTGSALPPPVEMTAQEDHQRTQVVEKDEATLDIPVHSRTSSGIAHDDCQRLPVSASLSELWVICHHPEVVIQRGDTGAKTFQVFRVAGLKGLFCSSQASTFSASGVPTSR